MATLRTPDRLPEGLAEDRRKRADRRRIRELEVHRVLGIAASATHSGFLTIRAIGAENTPAQITLPVEAAMTLLNDLQRMADEDRWFDIEATAAS